MQASTHINIQEPPVTELKKQRSCIKRSCLNGCGCIGMFFFVLLLLLNMITGSGQKQVKALPTTFPEDIQLYDTQRIESIFVSKSPKKGNIAEIASIFPKVILAGTYIVLDDHSPSTIRNYYDSIDSTSESWTKRFSTLMQVPLTSDTTQIRIIWKNLPAEPKFIQEYYTTNLSAATYTIQNISNTLYRRELLFEKGAYIGSILILDDTPDIKGTDIVELHISLPYSSL
jgi:hypothetical protein